MDELAIMRVSGVVLALMYLLRWAGVSPRWAPLLVPLLSVLGVGLWAYANGPISQPLAFSYVAGWVAVATSAATAWFIATESPLLRDSRSCCSSFSTPAPRV